MVTLPDPKGMVKLSTQADDAWQDAPYDFGAQSGYAPQKAQGVLISVSKPKKVIFGTMGT